jgi:hypothetical protein
MEKKISCSKYELNLYIPSPTLPHTSLIPVTFAHRRGLILPDIWKINSNFTGVGTNTKNVI